MVWKNLINIAHKINTILLWGPPMLNNYMMRAHIINSSDKPAQSDALDTMALLAIFQKHRSRYIWMYMDKVLKI